MSSPAWSAQHGFERRFEWGPTGLDATISEAVVVIVDVLRFSTAVEAATHNGVTVYPYRWRDESAATFATSRGAKLAHVDPLGPSLSPSSLLALTSGEAVVLPSPNGSTCAALAAEAGALVLAGCLRNAAAIGSLLQDDARPVTVIACGERWPDGSLRPAVEDFLGAGAVLAGLGGRASPEARAAMAAWHDAEAALEPVLLESASGHELCERGLVDDVRYAAERDVSDAVPVLIDGAFRNAHS
jgi:2-phosphosulfolactate phosphatase